MSTSKSSLDIDTTINFEHLNNAFNVYKGCILYGGSRSSKTWSIIQWLIVRCFVSNNLKITIGRDNLTTLKKTLYEDFIKIITGLEIKADINKSDMTCRINSNLIRFIGVNDDIMAAHGQSQDIFWLNEAMNISRYTFDQMEQRTSTFFILDYNPSAINSWLYDIELRDDVISHQTTVLDNPFAPPEVKKKILSYEPTPLNIERGTADEFMWTVYGLGKRGTPEKAVFKHFDYFDDMPETYDIKIYGLDFGYTNDPTAVVEVRINGRDMYVEELLYERGLTNPDIANKLINKLDMNCYVVCDSAEPKSIDELGLLGMNAIRGVKGADSIINGIQKLLTYRLHLKKNSLNLAKEVTNYQFKVDKDNNTLNLTIDKDNHLIDALRYSISIL